jgi:hypothetical protein
MEKIIIQNQFSKTPLEYLLNLTAGSISALVGFCCVIKVIKLNFVQNKLSVS